MNGIRILLYEPNFRWLNQYGRYFLLNMGFELFWRHDVALLA